MWVRLAAHSVWQDAWEAAFPAVPALTEATATQEKSGTNDNALLARVIYQHDREALEILHRRYYPQVRQYVAHLLGGDAEADDLTQEVFIGLFATRGHYDQRRSAAGYILGTAHNIVCRYARERDRPIRAAPCLDSVYAVSENQVAPQHDPMQQASDQEVLTLIRGMITRLSPRNREAIRLRFVEDLDSRQAAAQAGCSVGTFNKRLHAAIRELRGFFRGPGITKGKDSFPCLQQRENPRHDPLDTGNP